MNEEDAATVCVLAVDMIAFLDKADRRVSIPHMITSVVMSRVRSAVLRRIVRRL